MAVKKIPSPEIASQNKFMIFTPTITMGNIITAIAILAGAIAAWVQLNGQVVKVTNDTALMAATLAIENSARKGEIHETILRQDNDRADLYKKIASDHAETQSEIRAAQQVTHDDLREIAASIGARFDRVEDKLDKKVDKK